MILFINTAGKDQEVELKLENNKKVLFTKKFQAKFKQAEKLLPEIEKQLKKYKISMKDIKEIRVQNKGGSFTSLRIGVITANALGFGLNIPVRSFESGDLLKNNSKIVKPEYNGEPNIGGSFSKKSG